MVYSRYCTCLSMLITLALHHCLRQQTQLHDVLLILHLPVFSDHSGYCTYLSILMTVALHHCLRQQTQLHDILLILYLPVYSDHSGYCTYLSTLITVALRHCLRQQTSTVLPSITWSVFPTGSRRTAGFSPRSNCS